MGASVNSLKKETYKIVKLNSVLVGVAFVEVMLSVSAKKGLGQNLSEQVQIVINFFSELSLTVCASWPVWS